MNAKKIPSSLAVGLLVLGLFGPTMSPQQGVSVAEADNGCFSSHKLGGGDDICFSTHGNLVRFESPVGFEQIGPLNTFRDGYAICPGSPPAPANGGFDAGGQEAGFGAATIIQPGGPGTFPLTIIRDTTSGIYRLTQSFKKDNKEKDVTITMKVERLSTADCGAGCPTVRLVRYFEGDVDNNTLDGDRFGRTADSVWEWVEQLDGEGRPIRHGLMLTNRSFGVDHATVVDTVADHTAFKKAGCIVFAGQVATPAEDGANLVGYVFYGLSLPTLGSTAERVVLYRRF